MRDESGFSLLEVLVSTSIMLVVTAGIFGVQVRPLSEGTANHGANELRRSSEAAVRSTGGVSRRRSFGLPRWFLTDANR